MYAISGNGFNWFCTLLFNVCLAGLMSIPDLILRLEGACRNVSESIKYVSYPKTIWYASGISIFRVACSYKKTTYFTCLSTATAVLRDTGLLRTNWWGKRLGCYLMRLLLGHFCGIYMGKVTFYLIIHLDVGWICI